MYYRILENSITAVAEKNKSERDRIHKLIYKEALEHLGLQATQEELALHRKISSNSKITDKNYFPKINKYFKKIFKINDKYKKYEPEELKKELNYRWFQVCYRGTHMGFDAYQIYKKSIFSYKLSFKEKIKFLLKCFLKS